MNAISDIRIRFQQMRYQSKGIVEYFKYIYKKSIFT